MNQVITPNQKCLFRKIGIGAFFILIVAGTYFGIQNTTISDKNIVNHSDQYESFLEEHPFRARMKMSKAERKAAGLPPNAFMEQEYLYTSNPALLRPTPENLISIQEEISLNAAMRAAPGDASNSWVERGPTNVGGRTRALMFAPGSFTTAFAGGVSGGLWKSTNVNATTPTWTQMTGVPAHLNVTCITVDPNNTNIMYLGTGEVYTGDASGNGIYRSTDGGTTWVSVHSGGASVSNRVAFVQDIIAYDNGGSTEIFFGAGSTAYGDPGAAGPGYVFPGSNAIGLYKSTDGTTFTRLTDAALQISGNARSPNNFDISADGTLWMGTRRNVFGNGGGFVFSYDGTTWTNERDLGNLSRVEIACSKQDANKIYALVQDRSVNPSKPKIFRTTNGFASVTTLGLPNDADTGIAADDFTRGQSFYDLLLGVDPLDDTIVYVGGIDLFKTTNSGNTWNQFTHWYGGFGFQEVHADQHGIAFATETGATTGRILFGNDGGVAYTDDGGTNTIHINTNYNVTQFYKAGIAQTTGSDLMIAGAQDNGVQFIDDATGTPDTAVRIAGGDGCWVFVDQDSQYMIGSYVYNSYSYHQMDGTIVGNLPAPLDPADPTMTARLDGAGDFVNQCGLDSDTNILFTNGTWQGNYQIFRYAIDPSGPGVTTSIIDNALIDSTPSFFVASPYNTNRILVGTAVGTLIQMDNANATPTWTEIGSPSFSGSISDIRYGATDQDIMVTFHNYGVTSIWATSDGGTTWASKEGNLPDLPVKAILQNPLNLDEVIIGTYLGVWKTSNWSSATPTWTQSVNGMSDVKVMSFDYRSADYTILVATYGRGIFTGTFDGVIPTYCDSNGNTTNDTGITNVSIGTINNSDGPLKDNGYEDFTTISTDAVIGATCDLNVKVNTDGNNTLYTMVWVDWNNDKDFDDSGEEYTLGTATNVSDGLTTGSPYALTIPAGALTGNVRMRVSTKNGVAPTACEIGFDGEVEDYTINVTNYCTANGNSVADEYIGNVTIGTINNTSGGVGYEDFTTTVAPTVLTIGETPTISVDKVWTSATQYNEAVGVWIDFNKNGVFTDSGEQVIADPANQIDLVNVPFNAPIPSGAAIGNTRMRVVMKYVGGADTSLPVSCGSFDFGEVEDYTVTIGPSTSCAQTRTWTGTWSAGGAPTATDKAIFAANYNTSTANIDACEIEIQPGVTVTISAATYAKAEGNIIVNGTLIIEHEGSLVQVDDLATVTKGASANIEVLKTTPTIAPLGFMFMSSPMDAETRDGVYGTINDTHSSFRIIDLVAANFTVDPVLEAYAPYSGSEIFMGANNSFLSNFTASEALIPGKGLIVYPQASISDGNAAYNLKYSQGTLNNGVITQAIQYNGQTKNNFNLLGNPYASAIDAVALINANNMIDEVYFWEHITGPDNTLPGYLGNNYSMNDISMRNLAGGNPSGNGGTAPGRYIASGQGFAVKAVQGGDINVSFTNIMRVTGNNDQYRNPSNEDRLWISVSNEGFDLKSNALIAFLPQASEGVDKGYDSKRIATTASIFTTLKSGEQLGIQSRETFNSSMEIPVGFSTAIEESQSYTVSIDGIEGAQLSESPIYLIDQVLERFVNLKEEAYTFTSTLTNAPNRFVIVFEAPTVLGIEGQQTLDTSISLYPNPAKTLVTLSYAGTQDLKLAQIIDVNGKVVRQLDLSSFSQSQTFDLDNMSSGVYFMQVQGTTESTVKKLIIQ